jgi:putative transposase
LTFSCYRRQAFFAGEEANGVFVAAMEAARERLSFDIWAYVIMPEHVHLVICPRQEEYSISRILAAIKRPVAYRLGPDARGGAPHFWQTGGGYDRNLWSAGVIHKEVDYIHGNPVRRGLVTTPDQWRYSSAGYYAGMEGAPIAMDPSMPPR